MSDARPLQRAHGRAVTVELPIHGRQVTLTGTGRYADGQLQIDVKDPGGDFTLCLEEATFDGKMIVVGDKLTIRLNAASG
jgi:hypothetical protein